MNIGDEFPHPAFGTGTIISDTPEAFTVRFDSPPGMDRKKRVRIVPVMTFYKRTIDNQDELA